MLILFYRPPDANDNFTSNLAEILCNVNISGVDNVLMIGDLNTPEIKWDSKSSRIGAQQAICDILIDIT